MEEKNLELHLDEKSGTIFCENDGYNVYIYTEKTNYQFNHITLFSTTKLFISVNVYRDNKYSEEHDLKGLETLKTENYLIKKYTLTKNRISFSINRKDLEKSEIDITTHFKTLVFSITKFLKEGGYINCCQKCRDEEGIIGYFSSNKEPINLCRTCSRKIDKKAQLKEKRFDGILGGLLFSIPSIALALYMIYLDPNFKNDITVILIVLSGIIGVIGYKILGKKVSLISPILTSTIGTIMWAIFNFTIMKANFEITIWISIVMSFLTYGIFYAFENVRGHKLVSSKIF